MKLRSVKFFAAVAVLAAAIVTVPTLVGAIGPTGNGPMTLQSGTYTPTLAAGSQNVSSATFEPATWSRVGDTVTLSGFVNVVAGTAGFVAVNFDLPTDAPYNPSTSAFADVVGSTNAYQGVVSAPLAGGVYADTAQKKPRVWFEAKTAGSTNAHWTMQYQVK